MITWHLNPEDSFCFIVKNLLGHPEARTVNDVREYVVTIQGGTAILGKIIISENQLRQLHRATEAAFADLEKGT